MLTLTLSAPGKLFLAGEYAVLWGGEAHVLAVGPRATVDAAAREDRQVSLVVGGVQLAGEREAGGLRWASPVPTALAFAAAGVEAALALVSLEGGFSLTFSESPAIGGHKLGLGGSARAVVLACEAVARLANARADLLPVALATHRAVQGGVGSGADVAAVKTGGLVRFRRQPLAVAQVEPPRLPLLYAFSGQGASTPALISQVEARTGVRERAALVARSLTLGRAIVAALASADVSTARSATADLQALLAALGPTQSPPLDVAIRLARDHGGGGKISGAGGGDGCWLFAPDVGARDRLAGALSAQGLATWPLSAEPGIG